MASLKDVAKLANVSLMTVSRALNSPERLKPETLARVQAASHTVGDVGDGDEVLCRLLAADQATDIDVDPRSAELVLDGLQGALLLRGVITAEARPPSVGVDDDGASVVGVR